jgi:hypothetical protein
VATILVVKERKQVPAKGGREKGVRGEGKGGEGMVGCKAEQIKPTVPMVYAMKFFLSGQQVRSAHYIVRRDE